MKKLFQIVSAAVALTWCAWAQNASSAPTSNQTTSPSKTPNILFIIMDDVGIDQMRVFGYGGLTSNSAPVTPNIDMIAHAGMRFRNVWAMPECSPSRVMFFEGRYPLRTNIYTAILSDDLANSQLSPYEVTTPNLLKTVGYSSALFGKFHLGGGSTETNPYNPYGQKAPYIAGFDYFDGFLEGAPYPIDKTIGGQFPVDNVNGHGPYSCGFIPAAKDGGADFGACHFADDSCVEITKDKDHPAPGRSCLEQGGLFVPNLGCHAPPPVPLDFANQANAYYVWHRVINQPDGTVITFPLTDPSARRYIPDVTTESAVNWIKAQQQPWMATVSYASIHTPYQQAPSNLLPKREADLSGLKCTGNDPKNLLALRNISNQMLEAMDAEIGQLMVKSGLATYNQDGSLNYHPEDTNTMVVIIGDNGTYAPSVKLPFDPNLAKATVYQTGVWVPLIVAGPIVMNPDREVGAMVNVADLFQLFGEFVGVDVHQVDPHTIDSQAMLPYLTNPQQPEIRQTNFTQAQSNIHPNDEAPPPCVVNLTNPPTCVQLFPQAQLCEYEGGTWYGPGSADPEPDCCAVAMLPQYQGGLRFLPDWQRATRDDHYKLIVQQVPTCSTKQGATMYTEFYGVDELPIAPRIDFPQQALCSNNPAGGNLPHCPDGLTDQEKIHYQQLQTEMSNVINSQPACPGDGNEDLLVNQLDVTDWQFFSTLNNDCPSGGGGSSWYDFNHDACTNMQDYDDYILPNLGMNCQQNKKAPARLPRSPA